MMDVDSAGATAVAVGEGGSVWWSNDSGFSWYGPTGLGARGTWVPTILEDLVGVAVVDARRAIAVGEDGAVAVTSDAGAHWQVQWVGDRLNAVDCDTTGAACVIVGEDGVAFLGSMSATRWQELNRGDAPEGDLMAVALRRVGTRVEAWVAGEEGVWRDVHVAASSRGTSWDRVRGEEDVRGIAFLGDTTVLVAHGDGLLALDRRTGRIDDDLEGEFPDRDECTMIDVAARGDDEFALVARRCEDDRTWPTQVWIETFVTRDGGEHWTLQNPQRIDLDAPAAVSVTPLSAMVVGSINDFPPRNLTHREFSAAGAVTWRAGASLVRENCASARCREVFFLDDAGERHSFASEAIFRTWYGNFDSVVALSRDMIEDAPESDIPVIARPGERLLKFRNSSRVYALDEHARLRHITSETLARQLFGTHWVGLVDELRTRPSWLREGAQIHSTRDYDRQDVRDAVDDLTLQEFFDLLQ